MSKKSIDLEWEDIGSIQWAEQGPWIFKIKDDPQYLQTSLTITVAALPGADKILKKHAAEIAKLVEKFSNE